MKTDQSMFAHLREATRTLLGKGPFAATSAIQQALGKLQSPPPPVPTPRMRDLNPPPGPPMRAAPKAAPAPDSSTDNSASDAVPTPLERAQEFMAHLGLPRTGLDLSSLSEHGFELPGLNTTPQAPQPLPPGAQFISGSYRNQAGSRDYKLYIPSSYHGQAMPLVVMLHGCTQNPDDFAAGTQMNAVAEEKHCFVVYPAQAKSANSSRCWNWFNALDQQRDQGEPSLIAGIAQQLISTYPIDQRQVYVAGLSAGGAMAVIVGTLYPDLFAAVGVHSGLPFAAARDLPSALAAMRSGAASPAAPSSAGGIPIIVFHGDHDHTVHASNGEQVIAQGVRSQSGASTAPSASVAAGQVPNGHRYTRTTHHHADGSPLGEHWLIHGAGHAWSGGSAHGSYTDGKGPDASREMMRFFKTVV